MESNQLRPEPPSHGYRSYAELIKTRLIYGQFYAGWSVTQGRYSFRVMYAPSEERRWRAQPLGYEMTTWRAGQSEDNTWVLRTYLDGTALYRPHMLGWLRYPTMRTITAMLDYFFYKESEIREGHNRTHVLRRKPLNPQFVAPVAKGFGEFLTNKYNHEGA